MPHWDDDPSESIFMEITKRTVVGNDLLVPKSKVRPGSSPSIRLARTIKPGDVVIHYKSDDQAIVGGESCRRRA